MKRADLQDILLYLVDDVSEFVRLVNNIREHNNYDVEKVINEFWNLELLRTNRTTALYSYNDLKAMGFGLKELNFLFHTINEIAVENDIPEAEAIKKFLSDVEEQYDKKLGLEDKLQKMRDKLSNLRKEQVKLRTELLLNPLIGPKLLKLTQSGVSEQDIINVVAVFEKYSAAGSGNTDRQSLVSDLDKYAGLKSAIKGLTKEVDTLRKDAAFLENQKQDLDLDNQRIFSGSIHLRRIIDFLEGTAFSLRTEVINLALIYTFTIYLFESQFHNIQKLQSADQFD
jgi:hypothetical protein